MKTFGNLYIDDFLLEKVINEGIGKRTEKHYQTVFELFCRSPFITPSDLSTYTSKNFKRFLGHNFLEKKWSSATYNFYLRYLRCYCGFLKAQEFLTDNPFDFIKKRRTPEQLPRALTSKQTTELLDSLPTAFDADTFTGKRNQTIVKTYLYTGLRRGELLALKLKDVQIHDGYIKVIKGKRSKDRTIPLTVDLVKILIDYMRARTKQVGASDDVAFFPTIHGNHLQIRDIREINKQSRNCLTFSYTWHQLRHTFATELVRQGFDIYVIATILGHSKVETTKIYLSVDVNRLKTQLDAIALFA